MAAVRDTAAGCGASARPKRRGGGGEDTPLKVGGPEVALNWPFPYPI